MTLNLIQNYTKWIKNAGVSSALGVNIVNNEIEDIAKNEAHKSANVNSLSYECNMKHCNYGTTIDSSNFEDDLDVILALKRGDIFRQIGDAWRSKLQQHGRLVSHEMGKMLAKGLGEIQEIIDMCDFAVGLCQQLNGLITPAECPNPMMLEMWNSLGVVGVITAFNFSHVVLGWNACIALVCGDYVVWEGAIFTTFYGGANIWQTMAKDANNPLVSITTLKEAIEINNSVPQGLSSSIFTHTPERVVIDSSSVAYHDEIVIHHYVVAAMMVFLYPPPQVILIQHGRKTFLVPA
ncbi:hypothetical protein ACH5RR_015078 [Cinchona calisaya]|uniref:Aldehyde dehydrogenase domain-containing protein n=1 Tax=Cinchona calisaya TaxID=153742 RepID=A0ABD2ZSX3_9GENT